AEHRRVVAAAAGAIRSPVAWPSGTRTEDRAEPDEAAPAPDRELARLPEPRDRAGTGRAAARLAGPAVHAALGGGAGRADATLVAAAGGAVRRAAAARPETAEAAAAAAGTILGGFLRSPLRDRLARGEVLGREVPILHRDRSGRTWTGAC